MMETNSNSSDPRPFIIFVDDETMILELAKALLEPAGYRVRTFSDPDQALLAFDAAPPDLLVVDYSMVGMNGLQLLAACRSRRPAQKALLISGSIGSELCSEAVLQPDRFLPKPFTSTELIEAVRVILAG
jgi:CheY-like chemotaxis protein